MKTLRVLVPILVLGAHAAAAQQQDLAADVAELKALMLELQQDYEGRGIDRQEGKSTYFDGELAYERFDDEDARM